MSHTRIQNFDAAGWLTIFVIALFVCLVWLLDEELEDRGVTWHGDADAPNPFSPKVQQVVEENRSKAGTSADGEP